MDVTFCVQDGNTTTSTKVLVSDSLHLGNKASSRVPALVAQDAHDGLICKDGEADVVTCNPGFFGRGPQLCLSLGSVLAHQDVDLGDLEAVCGGWHASNLCQWAFRATTEG